MFRRIAYTVHLWVGISIGLYAVLIGATGAALVFRPELEQLASPDVYSLGAAEPGPVSVVDVIRSLEGTYPDGRIASIYAPDEDNPVYRAFVEQSGRFRMVMASPETGMVLGERRDSGVVRTLQLLHSNLLGGSRGRVVNGIGALLLLLLCVTGPVVWWRGAARWKEGLLVNLRRSSRRVTWELHGATGAWSVVVLAMWAVTGAYFAFPQPVERLVNRLSALTPAGTPSSSAPDGRLPLDIGSLVAMADAELPGGRVVGIELPSSDLSSVVIQIRHPSARAGGRAAQLHLALDQYTGDVVGRRDELNRSIGDTVLAWMVPLHFGTFTGLPLRLLWAILGFAPAALAVTGALMYWNRVNTTNRPADQPPGSGRRADASTANHDGDHRHGEGNTP